MKSKRSLTIKVRGKSPNTVTLSFTDSVTTEEEGVRKTESETSEDDFAIGSALFAAINERSTAFVESLSDGDGPLFDDEKKKGKAGARA